MTGDYMLLLILCFPFLGAFVVALLGRGEGAGNDTYRKRKTTADIGAGLVTVSEMLCFAVLFGLFWKGGNEGIRYDYRWEGFCGMGLHLCMDGFRALYGLIASLMWMMTTLNI